MSEEFRGFEFERPILELEDKIREIRGLAASHQIVNLEEEVKGLEEKRDHLLKDIFSALTPWQKVQLARHPRRPYTLDYINALFTDFTELHGDRAFADDPALVGGVAFFEGQPVMVMGQQKGRGMEEAVHRNFGMMHPEGYRKALRLMKLAEKFNRPVISFIDTPGAYPGIGAEERGQAEAIARNLREMSALKVPTVGVVIGEGGSGGALGIGVVDRVLMLENAWYSVISPEGCAAILFHDSTRAADAAKALKLNAPDLLAMKVIDEIVPEPLGGANRDPGAVFSALKDQIARNLKELQGLPAGRLLEDRYQKYRRLGVFQDKAQRKIEQEQKKARNGAAPKKTAGKPKAQKAR